MAEQITATPEHSPAHVLWEFCVHVFVGTLLFLIIYIPAVGLSLVVDWLDKKEINSLVVFVVQLAEYSLIFADTILLLVFLYKTTWRTCKKL